MSSEKESVELLKEMIEEVKLLKAQVQQLELENADLIKAAEDPTMMMKRNGWQAFVTPHADETFDPLNRDVNPMSTNVGPFSGSGDMITKSRHDELREWQDLESEMR